MVTEKATHFCEVMEKSQMVPYNYKRFYIFFLDTVCLNDY